MLAQGTEEEYNTSIVCSDALRLLSDDTDVSPSALVSGERVATDWGRCADAVMLRRRCLRLLLVSCWCRLVVVVLVSVACCRCCYCLDRHIYVHANQSLQNV